MIQKTTIQCVDWIDVETEILNRLGFPFDVWGFVLDKVLFEHVLSDTYQRIFVIDQDYAEITSEEELKCMHTYNEVIREISDDGESIVAFFDY